MQSLPAAASKVLGDDDLLGEILIHLIFPTSLVRAALVCRRWLRAASEPAFLRRFLTLHPPRLLGFYAEHASPSLPKFVPMPDTPPELATAVRRASSAIGDACASGTSVRSILSCLDGRLLVRLQGPGCRHAMLSPLHPGRDAVILPPPPSTDTFNGTTWLNRCLPDGGVAACAVWCCWEQNRCIMQIHELRDDGAWHNLTSPPIELPAVHHQIHVLPMDGTIFVVSSASTIAALRSASSAPPYMSTIALPDVLEFSGAGINYILTPMVNRSNATFCMMHVKDLKIHIWLHNLEGGEWMIVETICLRTICANSGVTVSVSQDGLSTTGAVKLHGIEHGAKSALIQVGDDVLHVHIKSRVVEKVYSIIPGDGHLTNLVPFMMVQSPVFPARKEVSD